MHPGPPFWEIPHHANPGEWQVPAWHLAWNEPGLESRLEWTPGLCWVRVSSFRNLELRVYTLRLTRKEMVIFFFLIVWSREKNEAKRRVKNRSASWHYHRLWVPKDNQIILCLRSLELFLFWLIHFASASQFPQTFLLSVRGSNSSPNNHNTHNGVKCAPSLYQSGRNQENKNRSK